MKRIFIGLNVLQEFYILYTKKKKFRCPSKNIMSLSNIYMLLININNSSYT